MKKKVFYILIWAITSVSIVVILYAISYKSNLKKNGFIRMLIKNPKLEPLRNLDMESENWYIAGLDDENIYLGNHLKPESIRIIDYHFERSTVKKFKFPENIRVAWRALKVTIDSPHISIYEGITPSWFHGNLSSPNLKKTDLSDMIFNTAVSIHPFSFITRIYHQNLKQNVISKTNNQINQNQYFALDKQNDGIFSTDGMMIYNKHINQFIYVYYYKNLYTSLDSNLQLNYSSRTIDTVTSPVLKIEKVSSDNSIKLIGAKKIVNKHAFVFKEGLYVESALRADNERLQDFNKHVVIDLYNLKRRQYLYSFYLPRYKNKDLGDFKIINNIIVALYSNHLVTFKLPYNTDIN